MPRRVTLPPTPLQSTPTAQPSPEPHSTTPQSQPSYTPTSNHLAETATIALPTLPTHGTLIYETDFQSGWGEYNGSDGTAAYVAGGYRIDLRSAVPWALWRFTTRAKASTFYAEIAATPNVCPVGRGAYGLLFHYRDSEHFRAFIITCSGHYALYDRGSATDVTVLDQGILPSSISDPANSSHIVGVRAFDDNLALYTDNVLIATGGVAEMPIGDIGPYVQTEGGGVVVTFTHLSVFDPQ